MASTLDPQLDDTRATGRFRKAIRECERAAEVGILVVFLDTSKPQRLPSRDFVNEPLHRDGLCPDFGQKETSLEYEMALPETYICPKRVNRDTRREISTDIAGKTRNQLQWHDWRYWTSWYNTIPSKDG